MMIRSIALGGASAAGLAVLLVGAVALVAPPPPRGGTEAAMPPRTDPQTPRTAEFGQLSGEGAAVLPRSDAPSTLGTEPPAAGDAVAPDAPNRGDRSARAPDVVAALEGVRPPGGGDEAPELRAAAPSDGMPATFARPGADAPGADAGETADDVVQRTVPILDPEAEAEADGTPRAGTDAPEAVALGPDDAEPAAPSADTAVALQAAPGGIGAEADPEPSFARTGGDGSAIVANVETPGRTAPSASEDVPAAPAAEADAAPVAATVPLAPAASDAAAAPGPQEDTTEPSAPAVASFEVAVLAPAPVGPAPEGEGPVATSADAPVEAGDRPDALDPAPADVAPVSSTSASLADSPATAAPGLAAPSDSARGEEFAVRADEAPAPDAARPEAPDAADPEPTPPSAEPAPARTASVVAPRPRPEADAGAVADVPVEGTADAAPTPSEPVEAASGGGETGEGAGEDDPDRPAIQRYAGAFDGADGRPLFAVVLVDDGTGVEPEALAAFDFPVTFAIDPALPDAAARAAVYREAGHEVALLGSAMPPGGDADALRAVGDALPETTALVDAPDGRVGEGSALPALAEAGRGLLAPPGADVAAAEQAGVPAATAYRVLDDDDQRSSVIARFLDRATFEAEEDGTVVVVGRTRPETVTGLYSWALGRRAEVVQPAPLSAVLLAP
ncbi:divergent polysaccharide deacetylase family protein [Jannaschia sp. W003]|uniref:divergent polysaccharide deacetylase family protein n=1 Tax=Jannaschia sp. W003 TaxID=2867012 RepID=UPI0021A6724D|nr:divergent polysaccharide deacetylase family protein [Jannaschia sp. W003]UWQ20278.1 divergent polysaccharide deacetylase family protein [Jannaschia sp. W003]